MTFARTVVPEGAVSLRPGELATVRRLARITGGEVGELVGLAIDRLAAMPEHEVKGAVEAKRRRRREDRRGRRGRREEQ